MMTSIRACSAISEENGTIENVKVENSYIKGGMSTGGVVAYNELGTVQNCWNEGTVVGIGAMVGGVVGCNREDSAVSNCCNTGTVTGSGDSVGGVAGGSSGTITDCYNTGAVTGSDNSVGGVAGNNSGNITSCYNTGAVTGSNNSVGGVAGKNQKPGDDYAATVQYCYNTGNVDGQYTAGGVTGTNNGGTVQYSYNTGNVDRQYIAGGVTGTNNGGTVQYSYNTGAVIANNKNLNEGTGGGVTGYNNGGTVRYCYNAGSICDYTFRSDGGVAGENDSGTVENCYYDKQIFPYGGISGQYPDPAGVVGKSTADMIGNGLSALLGTAESWVFTENLYPRLSGMDSTATPATDYDMESTKAAMLSACPAFFASNEAAVWVVTGFTVSTANGVTWSSSNESIISVAGTAGTVTGVGNVNLKASITDGDSTISRTVTLYVPSKDATLAVGYVKNQTVTDLGTPSGTLGSETAGAVTITPEQAADTEDNYYTGFYPTDYLNARVKVVKYASGADTSNFADDVEWYAYGDAAISDGDFFIVRVTAEDQATVNYYKIVVTVESPAYVYVITGTTGSFNVYRSVHDVDDFSALEGNPYSTVNAAMSAVTSAVGSGSTTLYFGETMTGATASTVSGTLDTGSEYVNLGSSGTYTLIGGLTSGADSCTLKLEGASAAMDGATVENTGTGNAVYNGAGQVKICGGTISGGTGRYGVYNASNGCVYLSSAPTITGGAAGLYTTEESTVVANDGEASPTYYSGDAVSVYYGGSITSGTTVAVSGVVGNSDKFTCANTGYEFFLSGTDLVISEPAADNSSGGGDYMPPNRTITVTETSSELFKDSGGAIKAEANVNNAFSSSVEVKVTDTEADTSGFRLGAGNKVYPFDISLYIKGTDTKTEPNDGYSVTISLPIPDELLDVKDQLTIAHKSDDGTVTTLHSQLKQINGVWYLVFEASEFSPYALVVNDIDTYDETAGLPYYIDAGGNEVFIGFAANGKCIAPSGVTVLLKQNAKNFSDTGSHWAKNYIDFVTEREIFNGTANNTFSPDTGMTRAMFATVIGRLYERSFGEIKNSVTHSFTDCDYDDYYGKYVDWAAKEGIIGGYGNGEFGPNDQISREQMAAILYRFANFLGALPADTGAALAYPDAGSISSWAQNAAWYCQQTGIITGRDGGSFVPQGTAARSEVAVILERFIKNVLD